MPIPFILGAIALGAAGVGIKKGIDAKESFDLAKMHNDTAQETVDKAKKSVENKKEATKTALEKLGSKKIEILSTTVNDFVINFERLKDIELVESEGILELKNFNPGSEGFAQLKAYHLSHP